ncbi:MAG: hypothetical protein ACRC13_08690 [Tannerellaceae bacterium]
MRIVISVACLQKLVELPKEVQHSTIEFIRKFEVDSKLASIHLEPISTFKDRFLRTARINQKYRAVLRIPNSDNDIYNLLWIDNHDEAMKWARNKVYADAYHNDELLPKETAKKEKQGKIIAVSSHYHFLEINYNRLELYLNGKLEKWQLFLQPIQW